MKRWVTRPARREAADALAASGLPPAASVVLAARGLPDAAAADRFLSPRLSDLSDPFLLQGMGAAVGRILAALGRGERIAVFGDYDADGVTAAALLTSVLRRLGAEARAFLPDREEDGYGLSVSGVRRCLDEHRPGLIVTVDCGVTGIEAAELARARGTGLVITDHHELPAVLPPHDALVNPKLGAPDAARALAGVGVAFKVAHALVKARRDGGGGPGADLDLRAYLDWVALGTVADVVPLTGENRILVRHGLGRINKTDHPGLRALIDVARIRGPIDAYHLAFMLGPRVNAAGRMGSAEAALDLFLEPDRDRAAELAGLLDGANEARKRTEETMVREALRQIEGLPAGVADYGIAVASAEWAAGVAGIAASRLCARLRRPVVVVALGQGDVCRGSARGIEGFDLLEALGACSDLLAGYGGHRTAAGVVVEPQRFEAFRQRFAEVCAARLGGRDLTSELAIDAWIAPGEADWPLHEALERMRPFGEGNPAPVLGLRGLTAIGPPRVVGDRHVRLTLAGGGRQFAAIGFNMAGQALPGGALDVAANLRVNDFGGHSTLELHLQDVRATEGG